MSEAFLRLCDSLDSHGSKSSGRKQNHVMYQCPAHPDVNPSLGVDDAGDRVLVRCYAGCQPDEVLSELGLEFKDLFDTEEPAKDKPVLVRSYLYEYSNGSPAYWKDRLYPKTFRLRLPGTEPGDVTGLKGREHILYHAPKVWQAMKAGDATVWLVDGEKDVESLERAGAVATCASGGAGAKWSEKYSTFLKGAKEVVIVADQDKAKPDGTLGVGQQYAQDARAGLRSLGVKVRIVAPKAGKDATDHLDAGFGLDEFVPEPTAFTRPRGKTAEALMRVEFEPLMFAVHDLLPAGLAIMAGSPKAGKALALDTPLLTTDGWTTMGDIKVGQFVYAMDGTPTEVLDATEVQYDHDCYRVTTRSGASVVADADHLWLAVQRKTEKVVTTTELAAGHNGRRWLLPVTEPVQSPDIPLPLDPWLLGYWLGNGTKVNGSISFNDADHDELVDHIKASGFEVGYDRGTGTLNVLGLMVLLRDMGVLGTRAIPPEYLVAGTYQRTALLDGLCDSDGHCTTRPNGSGVVEFSSTTESLAQAVLYLARSLGYKATLNEGTAALNGVDMGPKYRVCFTASQERAPVTFSRRLAALPVREPAIRSGRDAVESVVPVESVPVRCIMVAHPTRTYLAGRDLMVTHNTWLALDCSLAVAAGGRALGGRSVTQGSVLHLAREDNYRRLQSRLSLLMGGEEAPKALELVPVEEDWLGGEEGLANMTEWAEEVGDPRLVVIDTLAKVEPDMGEDRRGGAYTGNYSMMARYKVWAELHNCCVLMIHHDNKTKIEEGSDPFSRISGTRGLTGAADTLLFLESKRKGSVEPGDPDGLLHVTGRDVAEDTIELRKSGPIWTLL